MLRDGGQIERADRVMELRFAIEPAEFDLSES